MRKSIILILCLIISLSLISCTKSVETINTTNESSYSSNYNAKKESTTKPSSNSNEQNEKSITSLYVSYGGIKIDITSDKTEIDEIVAAEKSSKIPETKSGATTQALPKPLSFRIPCNKEAVLHPLRCAYKFLRPMQEKQPS